MLAEKCARVLLAWVTVLSLLGSAQAAIVTTLRVPPLFKEGGIAEHRRGHTALAQEALQLYRSGSIEELLKLLRDARDAGQEIPLPLVVVARMHLQAGRLSEAHRCLEDAVTAHAGSPDAYLELGVLALEGRRWAEAELCLQKVLQLRPKTARAYVGLAAVAESRQRWQQTQQYIEKALELLPRQPALLTHLAQALFRQNLEDQALSALRKAVSLDPTTQAPEVAMGWFAHEDGDDEAARRWMESALESRRDQAEVHRSISVLLSGLHEWPAALKHAKQAGRVARNQVSSLLLQGQAQYRLGHLDEAIGSYRQALQLSAGNAVAENNLAVALAERGHPGDLPEAVQLGQRLVQRYPGQGTFLSTLGWAQFKAGQITSAERLLRVSLAGVEDAPDRAYYLAEVLFAKDALAEAEAYVALALKSNEQLSYREAAQDLLRRIQRSGAQSERHHVGAQK